MELVLLVLELELEAEGIFVVPVHPVNAAAANRNINSGEFPRVHFLVFFIRKPTETAAYVRWFGWTSL